MAKLAKSTVYTTTSPQGETSLDKTTRIVRKMQEGETKKLHLKMDRLRNDRLGSEADAVDEPTKTKSGNARKKPPVKAAK